MCTEPTAPNGNSLLKASIFMASGTAARTRYVSGSVEENRWPVARQYACSASGSTRTSDEPVVGVGHRRGRGDLGGLPITGSIADGLAVDRGGARGTAQCDRLTHHAPREALAAIRGRCCR